MYVPHFNQMADGEVVAFLDAAGAAELVTQGTDGYPLATLMPFVREDDRLLLHMARANPHWKQLGDQTPALAIVRARRPTSRLPGTRPSASTGGWSRRGTTARCTSPAR